METERWAPVRGYEESYEVSDLGRVRSLPRVVVHRGGLGKRNIRGRIMKATLQGVGYLQVSLSRDGYGEKRLVHRMVLEAFFGLPPERAEACHQNGYRTDNRADNLRWDTHQSNINDGIRAGTGLGARTQCPQGHPYDADNTFISANGARSCRICRRSVSREYYARTRDQERPALKCLTCSTVIPWPTRGRPKQTCSGKCRATLLRSRQMQSA